MTIQRRPPAAASSSRGRVRAIVEATELGVERQCAKCGDLWPLDEEFFYRQPGGYLGFQGVCKACKGEQRGTAYGDGRGRRVDHGRIQAMLALGRQPTEIAEVVGCALNTVLRRKRMAA